MPDRPTLVLFPGAWGNKHPKLVMWWFRHVIEFFKDRYNIRELTYTGNTLDEYIASVREQLTLVPDGSVALCYSMGAQIARAMMAERPSLFRKVALISGLERCGVRVSSLLEGLTFALIPLLHVLILRPLMLDTIDQVKRTFVPMRRSKTGLRWSRNNHLFAEQIMHSHLLPEPARVVLRIAVLGLRRTMPAFPCPVLAIIPRDDFFVKHATYTGEDVVAHFTLGAHGLIAHPHDQIQPHLTTISDWFSQP